MAGRFLFSRSAMWQRRVQIHLIYALLSLSLYAGCSRKEAPRLTVFPVSGKILVDGTAPEKAIVSLQPVVALPDPGGRTLIPYAYVQPDGTFQVGTYLNVDGAPLGEYAVTISWPRLEIQAGEEVAGPDRLKGRYSEPSRPATKFVVKEGDNEIPLLELKSR